jgi:hypothetical protein
MSAISPTVDDSMTTAGFVRLHAMHPHTLNAYTAHTRALHIHAVQAYAVHAHGIIDK